MAQSTPARKKPSGYLPSLDGWRALAILGVMMTHDTPWVLFGHSNAYYKGYGGDGVMLFFAISGFLITTRILEEESLIGFFDIRGFYIRRFFRIQPPAFVYLGTIALLIVAGVVHEHWKYWFGALFLYQNFLFKNWDQVRYSFFTGHFWTLAVEEHFYLLLSLIFLIVRRYRLAVVLAFWFGLQVAAKIAHAQPGFDALASSRRTYYHLPYLLLASAAALALRWPPVRGWMVRYWRPWVAFPATAAYLVLHRWWHVRHGGHLFPGFLSFEMEQIRRFGFLLWILATVFHPRAWTTRLLEWSPLRMIGKVSYSLYLWHILFFFYVYPGSSITTPWLVFLGHRPYKYMAALAMAFISYYLVERPMMRLGHRLAPPVLPGRPELSEPAVTQNRSPASYT